MGCVQSSGDGDVRPGGKHGNSASVGAQDPLPTSQPKTVDPRLPFDNYRQLFNLKNSWKSVSRSMENTSKECLIRLFEKHPEYLSLHKGLSSIGSEEEMRENPAFEEAALFFFNTLDEVLTFSDGKVDMAIAVLQNAGHDYYAKLPGFESTYLKDMEQPFVESIRNALGDRFNESTEQNFRRIYEFCISHISN